MIRAGVVSLLGAGLLVAGVASVSGALAAVGVGLLLLGAGLWERAEVRA